MRLRDLLEVRFRGVSLLFHATDPDSAVSIIEDGRIEARTTARINDRQRRGLSLTRSASFADAFGSVIFGFSSEKLRRRYGRRMVPYADRDIDIDQDFHADHRREAEEFLMADLPLEPFAVGLWIAKHPAYVVTPSQREFFERHPLYAGIMKPNNFA